MFNIFLHISGIAFLEIMFYFLYIGPMETNIFMNTIKNSIKDYNPRINHIILPNNITNLIITNENLDQLKEDSDNQKKERNKQNNKLFRKVLFYWCISFVLSILLFMSKYVPFIKKFYNKKDIELVNLNEENDNTNNIINSNLEERSSIINNNLENSNLEERYSINNNIYVNKKNYMYYFKYLLYYILYGGLIILFEYIFFNYIVLKYQVLSHSELLYIFYDTIIPIINSYIINKNR